MSSNSTVVPSLFHRSSGKIPPQVVIVKPDSSTLDYSGISGSDKQDDKLKDSGLAVIQKTTQISFNFTGTGVAVIAMNHTFPPIPDQLLPRWSCSINNTRIKDIVSKQIPQPSSNFSVQQNASDIPSDNKARICQAKQLPPGLHRLTIQIDIRCLPAYFHSIRYKPLSDSLVTDALLRIDAKDQTAIAYNKDCWNRHDDDQLQSRCHDFRSMMNITFFGQSLDWFGWGKDRSKLRLTLDGEDYHLKDHHSSDNPNAYFTVSTKNQALSQHNLTILASHEQLTLDHLLVKVGTPTSVLLGDNVSPSPTLTPASAPTSSTANVIGAFLGTIIGVILIGLLVVLVIRRIRRRRRRNGWKDSALPSAMVHPASRVSLRSSFSREVVTGDIEYNPEAQKKLENANMTSVAEPPAAVILHTDSGVRIHLPASEVPPHYTRV